MQDILDGIRQPLFNPFFYHKAVHDNLNAVLDIFVQRDFLRKLIEIAVNTDTHIPAFLRPLQKLCMSAFAPPHHRGKELDLRPLRQFHDLVYHLVYRLLFNLLSALRAVRNPDSGIEQTEIVINLRHRSHRGTGVAVRRLLVNGNRRRKPLYALHVRFLHLPQKHPGVGRQRFHVPSLTLRIDRVKRERRFPRSAKAGQHYQLISRNLQIHIFQIMLVRSANRNVLPVVFLF